MARRSAQQRFEDVVLSLRPRADLIAWDGVTLEPWMIEELRNAETAVGQLRRQAEQLLEGSAPKPCASCGAPVTGRADRRYCSGRCRQAAYQSRQAADS